MIKDEITLVLMSFYCGIVFAIVYDGIRILRKLIKPSVVRVIVEDIIYWICVAYIFFGMLIEQNYGRMRFYPVAGMLMAMVLYEIVIGRRLAELIAGFLEKIIKCLLKPLKKICQGIKLRKKKRDCKLKKGKRVSRCRKEIRRSKLKSKGKRIVNRQVGDEEKAQQHQE